MKYIHPDTKHEMEDEDLEDHKENLDESMSDADENNAPDHHKTILKGMRDEMNEYKPSEKDDEDDSETMDDADHAKDENDSREDEGKDNSDLNKIHEFVISIHKGK